MCQLRREHIYTAPVDRELPGMFTNKDVTSYYRPLILSGFKMFITLIFKDMYIYIYFVNSQ
jgi:hypothetical protein